MKIEDMFVFIHKSYPNYEVEAITREAAFTKIKERILKERDFKLTDKEKNKVILKINLNDKPDYNPKKYLKD